MVSDKKRLLPANLERLEELAPDLRLTGGQLLARVWRYLDAETAERINNPYVILRNVALPARQEPRSPTRRLGR